jgi:DHA1 family tetracycline resistance protein-like MFS transporter
MLKSKALIAIFFIVFVDILAFTLVLPYLPFFAEHFGASPTQVGLILTSFSLCQFLAGPVLGRMSDTMGRKPILILSQIGTCLGFVILGLAQNLWMVYLARVLDGITAGNITVAQAAISDITKPAERARAFSLIGVSFGLGFFVGPAISAFLIHFGPQAPAWGAAFLSFCSILSTAFLFQDSPHLHETKQPFRIKKRDLALAFDLKPMARYLAHPKLKPLLAQFFCFNLSFSAHISCFALFAERRLQWHGEPFGPKEVGYLYAYLGFIGIAVRSWIIAALIRKFGERGTARIGFLAQALGFGGYLFVDTIPGALVASTISSIGSGLIRPTLAALMSHAADPKEQGIVFGVGQSLASIASIIAPIIAGMMIGHLPLGVWAAFAGVSMLLAFLFRDSAPEAKPQPH